VDWDKVEAADADEAELLRSLRLIDQVAQVHAKVASDADETGPAGQSDRNRDTQPEHWRHLTLLEHVGHGAFGDVYRARDTALDRLVALKLLTTGDAPDTARVSHLLNEARLLAKLRHPNVVRVYGAEFTEGRVGLWMELIEGRTLEDLLASHVTFGDKEAAQIGQQLCRAMAAVHGVGLVHRDIKARNVMREDGGRIVLMDFGAGADLRRNARGARDTLAGTPLYLAPELFDGGQPTVSADIYSLGVLLFHLVTGFYPVESHTRAGVHRAHQRRERKHLQDMRPDLAEAFIRVVARAIEHDPNGRRPHRGAAHHVPRHCGAARSSKHHRRHPDPGGHAVSVCLPGRCYSGRARGKRRSGADHRERACGCRDPVERDRQQLERENATGNSGCAGAGCSARGTGIARRPVRRRLSLVSRRAERSAAARRARIARRSPFLEFESSSRSFGMS
jgi:serine/threonine-protein kinase